ncbi:MAG: GGDEF domain-containing protein [Selenomonadaceae bacterium]|nr:GGDEF domain-containing protein [Selenomonadaceae bacterium]
MKKNFLGDKTFAKQILIVIAMAFLIAISVSCVILNNVIQSHDEELALVIAADVYDAINNELIKPVMVSRAMAEDFFLKQTLSSEEGISEDQRTELITNYLNKIKDNFQYSAAFVVSEESKNYYTCKGMLKKMSPKNKHDVWYTNFLAKNTSYEFHPDTDEANNYNLTLFTNMRMEDDDGNLIGVCGVGLKMSSLQMTLNANENAYGIRISLVDKDGLVQIDTNSEDISKLSLSDVLTHTTNEFVLKRFGNGYVITKFIPDLKFYLVIQSNGQNKKSVYADLILYMAVSFFVALVVLLSFIQFSLQRGRKNIEESATKHGLISHAGLYVSMHLIDLKNNFIYELSRDPELNLKLPSDGGEAKERLLRTIKKITSQESLPFMLDFLNFDTLAKRISQKNAIYCEFLSEGYGWLKAYFMLVDSESNGDIHQVVFSIEQIDEEKNREQHLIQLSETDAMTGLRNRGSGEKTITELMTKGKEGMFCLLDADKFKSVNDNFGHDVGDKVIKAIADCLKITFRTTDIVMRLGGDEFAAYALNVTDAERAKIIIDRLFNEIDKINIPELGDRKINISLGAAFFIFTEGCTFTDIYKRADLAVYQSKKISGNSFTIHKT